MMMFAKLVGSVVIATTSPFMKELLKKVKDDRICNLTKCIDSNLNVKNLILVFFFYQMLKNL
jgi:hypothetical protein